MFADVNDRAQTELKETEEVKVRGDRLLQALQASLEPTAEETTEKVD